MVEAAINTLARPVVREGARDPRTVDQRRGDALVQVCRRVVALTPALTATDPQSMLTTARPTGTKATVIVTIGLHDLADRTRPGVLVGGVDAGALLGPETIRGLVVDGDRSRRSSTPPGRRGWAAPAARSPPRYRRCGSGTAPASSPAAPPPPPGATPTTCGTGPTADRLHPSNGTLLCPRHHTIVHRDRLNATLTPTGIHWDQRPGSYDHALARAPAPPTPTPGG